jgi:hypothetical protein
MSFGQLIHAWCETHFALRNEHSAGLEAFVESIYMFVCLRGCSAYEGGGLGPTNRIEGIFWRS